MNRRNFLLNIGKVSVVPFIHMSFLSKEKKVNTKCGNLGKVKGVYLVSKDNKQIIKIQ